MGITKPAETKLLVDGVERQFISSASGEEKVDSLTINTVKIGDPAPPIVVRKWIKGNPVSSFKPGTVYLVEFWATWCVACQAAMPHLSHLAQKYQGKVEVLSFNVWEKGKGDILGRVEAFVKRAGDRMDYTVAMDTEDESMSRNWLDATGVRGIPEIFVIDQQGKLAWQGHPDYVDDVLDAVVNKTYDEENSVRIEELRKQKVALYDSLNHEMMDAKKAHDYKSALASINQMLPLFPSDQNDLENKKYELLCRVDSMAGRAYGEERLKQLSSRDQIYMGNYICYVITADSLYKPDYELALKCASEAARKLGADNPDVLRLYAVSYAKMGDSEKSDAYKDKYLRLTK